MGQHQMLEHAGEANIRSRSHEAMKEIRRFVDESINRRDFGPGDKLPNERDLALRFRTGRNTVRKALVALEREGKIERTVGRGTFIKAIAPAQGETVESLSGLSVIARTASPLDLMEFRLALEPDVAAAAVERAGSADIEKMHAAVRASRTATSLQEFEDLDDELHRAIAASCRNPLFFAASKLITAVRTEAEWGILKKRTLTADMRSVHTAEHVMIVEAIRRRDADGARKAMRNHLVNVRNMMFGPQSGVTNENQ